MPKDTFLHLTTEKKESFVHACAMQFAMYNYEKASLSKVVTDLKMAKGSIYQYFENKKDIYEYLIEVCRQKRKPYIQQVFDNMPELLKDVLKLYLIQELKFAINEPISFKLLQNIYDEKFSKDIGNKGTHFILKNMDFIRGMIERDMMKGIIFPEIEIHLLSYMVANIQIRFIEYVFMKYNLDYNYIYTTTKLKKHIKMSEVDIIAEQFANFVYKGIKN